MDWIAIAETCVVVGLLTFCIGLGYAMVVLLYRIGERLYDHVPDRKLDYTGDWMMPIPKSSNK